MRERDIRRWNADLEECVDHLSDCVSRLGPYPPLIVALALRTHLMCLLQEMLSQKECSGAEISDLLAELRTEVLTGTGSQ
jgi:hypothetical protein